MDEVKYTEALPLLEKLAVATPKDPWIQRSLAFALLAKATNTIDLTEAKRLRLRARDAFIFARDAGDDSPLVSAMIDSIMVDGGENPKFSARVSIQ